MARNYELEAKQHIHISPLELIMRLYSGPDISISISISESITALMSGKKGPDISISIIKHQNFSFFLCFRLCSCSSLYASENET